MQVTNPFLIFVEHLRALQIPHVITGSVAAIAYGEPRLTNDIDIVATLQREQVALLLAAFDPHRFYVPPPMSFS